MRGTEPRAGSEIRGAVRADLLSVFRIEARSFEQPWPYTAFERFLGAPGFLVAETEAGGDIVGYVVGDTIESGAVPIGHIKDLAVARGHRRRGLGRRLLSRALGALAAAGAGRVKLEVRRSNEAARGLYSSFGFEPHHVVPGYYDDGEDAHVLIKHLSP
ncbi:GNAT family acetyltransferase [Natronomonas moolapensis 8.8.11]|uniref:GNAT family acetyltransferase n=1 Tax=Natronomonas moolapensis (strain DSM 18674 / CECT 7526 / JCM 14361 / 8.8.11) TaxID=268739 RepID=M1XNT2_NATM8|nr:GNAT family N-acetyltransferase [Natronomonas moolapensis]CCQ35640.1 GNAT family acetyltransferase [Natronomonas moolapensis 8.8.11]